MITTGTKDYQISYKRHRGNYKSCLFNEHMQNISNHYKLEQYSTAYCQFSNSKQHACILYEMAFDCVVN